MKFAFGRTFALMALAVVLASVGAAAAMWSETLLINITVHTGEVDVKWSDWYCSDTGPDPQAPGFNNTEGKDVAKCYVNPEREDEEGDVIKLNVTLDNTYPGYSVEITAIVDNIGTVPVKLLNHSFTGLEELPLDVELVIPEDTQIDPGLNSTYKLKITVLQEAEENTDYSFDLTLTFAQWNEVS